MFSNLEPALASPALMAEGCMRTFYIEQRLYYAGQHAGAPLHAVPGAYHFTQLLWRGSRRLGVGVAVRALRAGSGPCVPNVWPSNGQPAWMFYVNFLKSLCFHFCNFKITQILFQVVLRYDPIGNQANPGDGYAQNVLPLVRRMR